MMRLWEVEKKIFDFPQHDCPGSAAIAASRSTKQNTTHFVSFAFRVLDPASSLSARASLPRERLKTRNVRNAYVSRETCRPQETENYLLPKTAGVRRYVTPNTTIEKPYF
jgi:hypothetical protein